ncbi:hypothetical protein K469DRAFT_644737 [Zopfia rhizophila CBS 207.26]|uniref:Uncharacterized protein n=1 Tax=Zopfia rhizophila CBS 207.26 TaxID=1314779 RepID=A0A6A6DCS9_9PEZI|nr:hypothetical protein K469DRAFT_644737 [Zopfia rhizophila CBS 207.26]
MDKVKKVLHVRSKSKVETESSHEPDPRGSVDEEVAAMSPEERAQYLKEFEEAERTGGPKKGSLLDKLIERGNRRTQEQLAQEARDREAKDGVIR